MLKKLSIAAAGVTMISLQTIPAHAAQFNFTFDATFDDELTEPFVGSGVLSFDGDAQVGSYTLDSLSNLDMNFSFNDGSSFGTADLTTNLSSAGISIFDLGAGELGLVFTGEGGLIGEGSVDLGALTFEPTPAVNNPGFAGGNGVTKLYFNGSFGGSYTAVSSTVSSVSTPEPASILGLLALGTLGVTSLKRNKEV